MQKISKNGGHGRIAALKQRSAELTSSMQTFCLEPTLWKFNQICAYPALRKDEDNFKIWRIACLYKYGEEWELKSDPDDPSKPLNSVELAFTLHESKITERAIKSPSYTLSMQIIHIFYALGELKYIDLFYQCMGHERLPLTTKQQLIALYRDIKGMYQIRVSGLLAKDPDHFKKLELVTSVVNFTYFDDVKERAVAEKKKLEERNRLLMGNPGPSPASVVNTVDGVNTSDTNTGGYLMNNWPEKIYGIN